MNIDFILSRYYHYKYFQTKYRLIVELRTNKKFTPLKPTTYYLDL